VNPVTAGAPFSFSFEDRTIAARPGQTIAAALYAAGQRIFSRSFKYHRPRGLFCVAGECPNCLMAVAGRPNVRTCVEPARPGQIVEHQNAWPSLEFDALRIFDRVDRMLPVGFYYKRFHKPRWLWPLFERVVRHLAGNGRIDVGAKPAGEAEIEHLFADICVIGGGPAGLAAAAEAASAGAQVLLVERLPHLGGHLLYEADNLDPIREILAAVWGQVRVLLETSVFGLYEGNLIAAFQSDRFLKIRARHIVVCTGGRQRPLIFHNNDLPGVFLGRGAQRLSRLYGVPAGKRAVILSERTGNMALADSLSRPGIEIAGIVGLYSRNNGANAERWPAWPDHTILAAHGGQHLEAVEVARMDAAGAVEAGSRREIPCDLLCIDSALLPSNELLLQAGARFQLQSGRWRMTRTPAHVSAAGAAAGTSGLQARILEGQLRGAEAADRLGFTVPSLADLQRRWEEAPSAAEADPGSSVLANDDPRRRKRFVCICEDVTEKDLRQAVAEGFDEIETLKRYSTVNMGPCQGKVCGQAAIEICGQATCRDLAAVGSTTSRPPVVPVEMGIVAASALHPVRRTPLHHWHEARGVRWLDAGLWKRPEHYGDLRNEVRAIRTGVGLIDVSTLGKIEVVGPGATELLERTYVNRWSDLKAGATRYGVMCNEDGILFDDGVGTRLGADRYYLTSTTGNAEAVYQWLEQWRVLWRLDVTIINHTAALAGMNLAGPQARQVLRKLTALDLSNSAFPYLGCREADVGGVPCRLFRIGFVGELGYEIHCPSAYALHVWEALVEAGSEFGIMPCGIEAQRVLRLEKGHLIIGVDSDALSQPFEANLEWLVRLDKPRFHGREPLMRLKARGPRARLIGFTMEDRKLVPDEGCQVVEQGRPAGRVTSARFSPTLEQSIGLAWVPVHASEVGTRFQIRWNGTDRTAIVTKLPFYDPSGKRMRG
jgi:sarcosine oxidase subunit alpha